ncbi:hypothetical protein AB0B37_47440, partial [Streptomyces olivaceoviridis]
MRIRPIMLIAATATAIATAGGVASAATGTPQPTATAHGKPSGEPAAKVHGTGSAGASVVSGTGVSGNRVTA